MNREGRGFCEIEFDKHVFITWKKTDLQVRHELTITSFTKEPSKTSEGRIEIWFGFAFQLI